MLDSAPRAKAVHIKVKIHAKVAYTLASMLTAIVKNFDGAI